MMLLGEPPRSQFDLNFRLLGIRVRITPWFWLGSLILGANITQGKPNLVLMWAAAVLISLVVHEFGHALTFRLFGVSSHIVLYQFGGIAVPDGFHSTLRRGRSLNSWEQILISLAGPALQLFFAALVMAAVYASGHAVPFGMPIFPNLWPIGAELPSIQHDNLRIFIAFLLFPSVYWALLNLLPVYPLDGGQISREAIMLVEPRQGLKFSLILSVAVAGAMAVYGLTQQDPYLALMFAMLGFSSYQALQAYTGRGGGFGR